MTVEQLLLRRFVLENWYPGSNWNAGAIIHKIQKLKDDLFGDEYWYPGMATISFETLLKVPYLWRELKWYEERKAADMPMYVKDYRTQTIKRADKWDINIANATATGFWTGSLTWTFAHHCEPSTEAEFLKQNTITNDSQGKEK